MPRKGNIPKRDVLPDPVYGSVTVAKLINSIMLDGKKGTAQAIVYGAFDMIKEQTGEEPLEVFEKAMSNIMPVLEVKAKRIGGANYQVPVEVRPERRQTLGLRWLTKYTRARGERTMAERLAKELTDITMDGGNEIYGNIAPLWDGEDGRFDLDEISPDELKCFPNLRKIKLMSSKPEKIVALCEEYNVEATT